jgi:hypothetical protein
LAFSTVVARVGDVHKIDALTTFPIHVEAGMMRLASIFASGTKRTF